MRKHYADRVGIWLSSLCLIHCMLTPLILLGLPALSLFKFSESLHQALAVVLPVIALVAFIPGYRHHRRTNILWLAASGLMLIVGAALGAAALSPILEALITITGSLALVRAHWLNERLHRASHARESA